MIRSGLLVVAATMVTPAAASAAETVLLCQEAVLEAADGAEAPAAKSFTLRFTQKGNKLKDISAADPELVLDPMGAMPVYSGGTGSDGAITITVSEPPPLKPLKLKGKVQGSGYSFTEDSTSLVLILSPDSTASDSYSYEFSGSRLMGGVFRAMYEGQGTCTVQSPGGE